MADHDQILKDIGTRVRQARTAMRLSQRDLAAKVGVVQSQVSEVETGTAGDVRLSTLLRFAGALDTTLVHLVSDEPTADKPAEQAAPDPPSQVEVTVSVPSGTVTIKAGEPMAAVSAEALRTLRTARQFGDTAPAAGQIL